MLSFPRRRCAPANAHDDDTYQVSVECVTPGCRPPGEIEVTLVADFLRCAGNAWPKWRAPAGPSRHIAKNAITTASSRAAAALRSYRCAFIELCLRKYRSLVAIGGIHTMAQEDGIGARRGKPGLMTPRCLKWPSPVSFPYFDTRFRPLSRQPDYAEPCRQMPTFRRRATGEDGRDFSAHKASAMSDDTMMIFLL